ncbi:ATP-dependent Clp protease proteolytic subunit [Pedobacter antarcticus]|uniref:ATP-dependent Clp protease proteolytic subunit n=1 Tax=Pedobacter antarcticus TaxID=34086 RepID=UPI00292DD00C|nr:ATP-dependent Clp protease proteolytic subunit [Pedobacter antarcticus]
MNTPSLKVVRNEAKKSAQIFLYGTIGDFWYSESPITAKSLQRQLSSLHDVDRVDIHLNGPGGDVHEGLAMSNIIRASKKEIHTWNDGLCASMFAIILVSAKQENRHGAKGSLTMIHSASTGNWGNATEMRECAEMLDKHDDVLGEFLVDATGLDLKTVRSKWMDGKDHWMTAKEAAAENLLQVEDYQAQALPENITTAPIDQIAAFYNPNKQNQNPQINNESMLPFTNKFKSLTALAKVAVNDITPELVQAVNDEIVAEKIPGVTLVLDSALQSITEKAEKVEDLETEVVNLKQKIEDQTSQINTLSGTVENQKEKLSRPASTPAAPLNTKVDPTLEPEKVVDSYRTSVDDEAAKYY